MTALYLNTFILMEALPNKQPMSQLSTTEKVIILKSVNIFAETPDDILAEEVVAALDELQYQTGDAIFHKGDIGDSLYIIVNGRVRVHDGEMTLNHLGKWDVFGEMAALDPEPRLASVTAVEDTILFRLNQQTLYNLMGKRFEIASGIIRVLIRYVRARVKDLAEEFKYIQQVSRVTAAAAAIEAGIFVPESLDEVTQRSDELGQLARVFQRMAREVQAREQSFKQEISQLRIEIDEAKRQQQVSEVVESEYFRELQQKVKGMRKRRQESEE